MVVVLRSPCVALFPSLTSGYSIGRMLVAQLVSTRFRLFTIKWTNGYFKYSDKLNEGGFVCTHSQ